MRKLSIVLIIAGILVGISPLMGQLYNEYLEYRMMVEWLESSEDVSPVEEDAEAADPEEGYTLLQEAFVQEAGTNQKKSEATETATVQSSPTPKPAKPEENQQVLGIIRIDKIKVKAMIVEGVKASNLRAGVGHIPGTAALGEPGNCALAGHRSYTFGKFFNRLDEIVKGDEIIITTKKGDLKYKVYDIKVVTPDDVSVLKGSKSDNIITLITCTPIYIASHRLIVHARLEDKALYEP